MRKKVQQIGNQQWHRFRAKFCRLGYKVSYGHFKPTLLLTEVELIDDMEKPQVVTSHLWFNYTTGFQRLGQLQPGDVILFNARVHQYRKGYFTAKQEVDYNLSHPSKVGLASGQKRPLVPEDNVALIGMIMMQNKDYYLANDRPYEPFYVSRYQDWLQKG